MSDVYVLQNQARLFLGKQKDWLDGRDAASLFKTPHKDEAINLMFEVSSRDYSQRIRALACKLNEKGLPVIPEDMLPEAGSGAPAAPGDARPLQTADENIAAADPAEDADELPPLSTADSSEESSQGSLL